MMVNSFTRSGLFGSLLQDEDTAIFFGSDRIMAHVLAFERAYSEALGAVGVVSSAALSDALDAIDSYQPDLARLGVASDRDGLPVPALVGALREGLTDDAAAAIHTGATSQDVLDTAMVICLRDVVDLFTIRLDRILSLLQLLDQKHGRNGLMGRTRMQAALPITVSDRLRTWRAPLARQRGQIADLRGGLSVQFGGAVGLRDQPEGQAAAVLSHLSRILDLSEPEDVWHSDRSSMVAFGHWLTLVAGSLGKLGQDIALMAQQGIDEVRLSGVGGSSAMPHKQNPIAAEMLVALARFVAVQQSVLAQAMIHEQERSGQAWTLEWLSLPAMAEATGAALVHAERLLESIEHLGSRPER